MKKRSRCALFESLEVRRLMHDGHAEFHINFQPVSAPVPADYLVDAGQAFGLRVNGQTYGWSADNQSWARDRNSSKSPDQRYDTLNVFNGLSWEIALPNDKYNVHIVAGDASYPVGNYKIDAEGVRVIDGAGSTSSPWLEGSANVTVTDGKLTLTNGAGAGTNKICFIDIGEPASTLPAVNVVASDANATEGGDGGSFTFTRGGDLSSSMIVKYVMSGSASSADYGAISGAITIPAGQASAMLTLSPVDDALAEGTENATLTLVEAAGYQLGSSISASVSIADNDVTATSFSAKINFQPSGKPIPSGYLADVGSIFGARSGGLNYGWSADNTAWARDRDSSKSPDQRYDTLNVFNSLSWELAVPNGSYDVHIVAGDASYPVGNYKIDVEGVRAIDGSGTSANPWLDKTVTVKVTDGKLTVSNAPGAGTNKICFIEVMPPGSTPTPPPAPSPTSNTISWTTKAANPIIRAEALRTVVDGKLYVFGGFSGDLGPVTRSDVYDPVANTWTQLPNLPKRITHTGIVADGHDIYVAGGYVGIGAIGYAQQFGTTEVWKYNIDTKLWTSIKAMPKAMAGGGAVVIGRTLYYISGDNSSRADDGSVFALNLDNIAAGWTTRASLTNARSHFGYVVLGGKIYVVGGQHGNDAALTTQNALDVYDPATNTWKSLTPAPLAISHIASATVVLGNRIVMLGGETANGVPSKQVNAYDPATNSWSAMTSLPATRFSGVAGVIDGAIYFTTGSSQTTTWKGSIV